MKHPEQYAGLEVVVLGLARSGQAVAKVFHERGALVTVNDRKEKSECPEADGLERLGVRVVCGGHPDGLVHAGTALVVKNPGIPYTAPPVAEALKLGVEVVTEVEVAGYLSAGRMIGITGSNGKTTTTTWIGRMLEEAGLSPIVAGNIGTPLCEAALTQRPDDWLVAELSSFQLKGTERFRPDIACLLNVYETHLDYHGDMADYVESKLKLFANQRETDIAVLNWDCPVCRSAAGRIRAALLPFSATQRLEAGVWVEDGAIVYRPRDGGDPQHVAGVAELGIPGSHNVENALAAAAVSIAAGASLEAVRTRLRAFRGVEHRQEFVREAGGVRYFNDSKATNPAAAITAIRAFDAPVVWIGGGLDRGSDYMELLPWVKERVKAVVLIGATRVKLRRVAEEAGLKTIEVVDTALNAQSMIEEAVRAAAAAAEPGDVVLFSPACASWDMFASYEQRGSMFKSSVHRL